jgi:hypothetical protein
MQLTLHEWILSTPIDTNSLDPYPLVVVLGFNNHLEMIIPFLRLDSES